MFVRDEQQPKTLLPRFVTDSGITNEFRALHESKAPSFIDVIVDGSEIFVKEEQFLNIDLPITVKDDRISISLNSEQSLKHSFPIDVIVDGIVYFTIGQPAKTSSPSDVTEEGISIFANNLHLENVLFFIAVIEDGKITFLRDLQFSKTPTPIKLTVFGISIDSRFEQPLNAKSSILVTDCGIVIFLKLELSNALIPITVM